MDGPIANSLMVADRLDLLRLAVVPIISVDLSPGVANDLPCLVRVDALGDAFTVAVTGLRAHTHSNYSIVYVPEAHVVLCDMINRDIALYLSDLTRAVQRSSPAFVTPPAGTGFNPPPLTKFVRPLEFCRCGGRALWLVLGASAPTETGPPSGRSPLPSMDRPGPRERPVQASPSLAGWFSRTGRFH